jgi:hypothetical protein
VDGTLLILNSLISVALVSVCHIKWETFQEAPGDLVLLMLIKVLLLLEENCSILTPLCPDLGNIFLDLFLNKHGFNERFIV